MCRTLVSVFLSVLLSSPVWAVPTTLTHQGHILNADETPLAGVVNATFRLYPAPTGGSALWTQTLPLVCDNGYYTVTLGPGTPSLSPELFNGDSLYLGITLENQNEFSPRHKITSVPYSQRAAAVTGEVHAVGGLVVDGQQIIDGDGNWTLSGTLDMTDTVLLPRTTLADLPTATEDNEGQVVFVTDEGAIFVSDGTQWINLSTSSDLQRPTLSSVTPNQIEPETDITLTLAGLDFEDGCDVEINHEFSPEVIVNSSTEVTATTGNLLTSGSYNIRLSNPSGLRDTLVDSLIVDAIPTWITTEGSLGNLLDSLTGDHFTLEATDIEGTLTYSVVEGDFPPGLSLDTNTGVISGDPDDVSGDTEYSFTVRATDTAPSPNEADSVFSILVLHRVGHDPSAPATSCKHIRDTGSSDGDGLYWLLLTDESDASQFYCDMTTDEGGWTLIYSVARTSTPFQTLDNIPTGIPTEPSDPSSTLMYKGSLAGFTEAREKHSCYSSGCRVVWAKDLDEPKLVIIRKMETWSQRLGYYQNGENADQPAVPDCRVTYDNSTDDKPGCTPYTGATGNSISGWSLDTWGTGHCWMMRGSGYSSQGSSRCGSDPNGTRWGSLWVR